MGEGRGGILQIEGHHGEPQTYLTELAGYRHNDGDRPKAASPSTPDQWRRNAVLVLIAALSRNMAAAMHLLVMQNESS